MRKNKKLLTALALNSLAMTVGNAGTKTTQIKYEQLYNKIIKNAENGKSNQSNYDLLENILNKRNKELKDLYLQGNYIVKPEYLEWQIFFNAFSAEKSIGEGNKNDDSGIGRDFRITRIIKLGATVPAKVINDFELDLEVNVADVDIKPINIELPVINVEKMRMIEPLEVKLPVVSSLNINVNVNEPNITSAAPVNLFFNAGHSAGAPPLENPNAPIKYTINGSGNLITALNGSDSGNRYVVHSDVTVLVLELYY